MADTRIRVSAYSRKKGRARQTVYTRVTKTAKLKSIIAYAKGKGSSMTAATAAEYERLGRMDTIVKVIDHDIGYLKAASPWRVAIPKALAKTSVDRIIEARSNKK